MNLNISVTRIRLDFSEEREELSLLFGSDGNALKLNFTNWTNGLKVFAEARLANRDIVTATLFDQTNVITPLVVHETMVEKLEELPIVPVEATVMSDYGPVKQRRGRPKKNANQS